MKNAVKFKTKILIHGLLLIKENSDGNLVSGVFITDLIKFENLNPINYTIGCHNIESEYFMKQKANGIIGLGLNKGNQANIVSQLFNLKLIEKNLFTLCLSING